MAKLPKKMKTIWGFAYICQFAMVQEVGSWPKKRPKMSIFAGHDIKHQDINNINNINNDCILTHKTKCMVWGIIWDHYQGPQLDLKAKNRVKVL